LFRFPTPARTWRVFALGAVILALTAGCGGQGSDKVEVDMGIATFAQDSVTVKAGQAVHFVDPDYGGGVHVLCIGKDLKCVSQPGTPAGLDGADGVTFNPGDTRDIVFATAGSYDVVCTIHPGMVVTVIVQ
jgi:plastocyanin